MLAWIPIAVLLIWISIYDIRFHLIRNIDLVMLLLLSLPYIDNWLIGALNLFTYTLINLVSKGRIGIGDIKLSLLIGMQLNSISLLLNALSYTWIFGGIYASLSRSTAIAFAPFMICGTLLAGIT